MAFHMLMKKAFEKIFFGLHENHTSKVLDLIKKTEDRVRFNTYDSVKIRKKEFKQELCLNLSDFSGEIDLDAIPNIASAP
jgi:formiminoglutamase